MQRTRRAIQIAFVGLTLVGVYALKGNAEQWCPFGGVEALYSYAREGNLLCSLGISNFYILAAVLLSVLLLKRAFCGFACPIGAMSEWLHAGGKAMGLKRVRVTGKADRALALLKYAVIALILVATWRTSELVFRAYDPCYALISRHGEDITYWAYIVSAAIVVASLFISVPFCRWLCPLAVVMNPLSRIGLARVKRDGEACTGCRKCTRVCPAAIPVDQVTEVLHARCIACTACVDVCPEKEGGALIWGPPNWMGRSWPRAALVTGLLICIAAAVGASVLAPLPSFVKIHGQPPAQVSVAALRVDGLTCRGRASLFVAMLERDDLFALAGESNPAPYFKLEAWPGPGAAEARITYDAKSITEEAIKQAVTQPFYDLEKDRWYPSPFTIAP